MEQAGARVRVGLHIRSLYLPLALPPMKGVGDGKIGRRRESGAAPGDGFWSKMMALVFFMTTVSCKSLADHVRGKFPMETILGRRARLYRHA